MSRFAVDPRWLLYLPPTMAPVRDLARGRACSSTRPRRSPPTAAEGVRAGGLRGEAHGLAGGRAGLPRRRRRRRGSARPTGGAARCTPAPGGRSSAADLTDAAAATGCARRVDDGRAVRRAGHATGCCSTPSCCRGRRRPGELLRDQYAAVGAAARRGAAGRGRGAGRRRPRAGVDVGDAARRGTRRRAADADAFTEAYRRYCWPTDGLDGVRAGAVPGAGHARARRYHDRDHGWHLALADRLVAADPELIAPTAPAASSTSTDPASSAAAIALVGRS